jgi:hypothetical protein
LTPRTVSSPALHGAVVLALGVSWLLLAAGGARAAQDGELRVALLPMVVHSAEEPRYLREGMGDMLESRLERNGQIRVVRVEDPATATTRLARAVAVGRQYGADFVLYGSFTRFGEGASLDLTCAPTRLGVTEDDQLREIFVQSGSVEEVIPGLDALVGKVVRFMKKDVVGNVAADGNPRADAAAPDVGGADAAAASPAPAAAASRPGEAKEIQALRKRIEALEAAVYGRSGAATADPATSP